MTEHDRGLLFIDIDSAKTNNLNYFEHARNQLSQAHDPLWTRSDNSFKFNFLEDSTGPREQTLISDDNPKSTGLTLQSITNQRSGFAFNFQIPSVPLEDMKAETAQPPSPDSQSFAKDHLSSDSPMEVPSYEPLLSSKAKKNKSAKTAKSSGTQQKPSSAESCQDETAALTAEEQLQRELDWCIEKLELGMRTQKGTPKQKEEASRALKTLRSSKAPLAKKRQVMRAMTGDYRKKMEEEKEMQFKLIQKAVTSAQVKAVTEQKKAVFHRRAGIKTQTPPVATESSSQRMFESEAQTSDTVQRESSDFVFTPSKDEFHFNFL